MGANGNDLLRQIDKNYRRSLRRDKRMRRRLRRRREGGWIYRTFLWPDPMLAIAGYLLMALVALLAALLLYGQFTHGGDPLWWGRCSQYGHCPR